MWIRASAEWALCLDRSSESKSRRAAEEALLARVQEGDIPELISLLSSESVLERYLAVFILGVMVEEERLPDQHKPMLQHALERLIDNAQLMASDWMFAHDVLDSLAGGFRVYLEPDLRNRGTTVAAFDEDLSARHHANQAAAVPRVRAISVGEAVAAVLAALPDEAAPLQTMRVDIEAWVTEWHLGRKAPAVAELPRHDDMQVEPAAARALSRLYYNFICRLPERALPLKQLMDLLGQPDSGDRVSAYYGISSGSGLLLLADGKGLLEGWKMN